jgi:uncharacterized membrane protein HdeD (DUF308 family)
MEDGTGKPDGSSGRLRPWQLPGHWGWVLALGALLVALGAIAIWMSLTMVLTSVLATGWFLLVSGLLQVLHTFSRHPHRHFGLDLMIAVSCVVLGVLIVSNPGAGARELALLLSMFLTVTGIYSIVAAAAEPIAGRGAVLVSGLIALFLGIHLWTTWMNAGFWLIGFYVGIYIGITGWSLMMRGLAEKRL